MLDNTLHTKLLKKEKDPLRGFEASLASDNQDWPARLLKSAQMGESAHLGEWYKYPLFSACTLYLYLYLHPYTYTSTHPSVYLTSIYIYIYHVWPSSSQLRRPYRRPLPIFSLLFTNPIPLDQLLLHPLPQSQKPRRQSHKSHLPRRQHRHRQSGDVTGFVVY